MSVLGYANPNSLRQGIADRLRQFARARGSSVQLDDLLRQFAYDRLLCRVFTADPDRWVLKGATAMLARLDGIARHTRDVDLYNRIDTLRAAERELRSAAAIDLGDLFRFSIGPAKANINESVSSARMSVVSTLGLKEFARFHIDLVTSQEMTGSPELAPPLLPIELPGLTRTSYRIYPIADHIADKVCALLEVHSRFDGSTVGSTRFRDLVDLTTFARATTVEADALTVALETLATRRRLTLPRELTKPPGSHWTEGYIKVQLETPNSQDPDLDSAIATVGRFLNPVLSGRSQGRWDPVALIWR